MATMSNYYPYTPYTILYYQMAHQQHHDDFQNDGNENSPMGFHEYENGNSPTGSSNDEHGYLSQNTYAQNQQYQPYANHQLSPNSVYPQQGHTHVPFPPHAPMGSWNQNLTHDHAYGTQNTANPSVPPASTPQSPGWVPWQPQQLYPEHSALSGVMDPAFPVTASPRIYPSQPLASTSTQPSSALPGQTWDSGGSGRGSAQPVPRPTTTNTSNRTMHTCTVCGYKTNRPYDLQRHELIHTDNKPFPCPKCGERFNRKDNAKSHCQPSPGNK